MTDPPLGRRRFAATLVALAVSLAGCTNDDTGNPDDPDDDGGNPDDAAVDLSDNGLDAENETRDDRNASDADDD